MQNNLGLVLLRQGRRDEAIALFEEGLTMAVSRGGETSRYALPVRGNLAEAYVNAGRIAEAQPLAETAVRIATSTYGEDSPFTAAALRAHAAVRIAQGRAEEARTDLARAEAAFARLGKGGELQRATLVPLRARLAALPPH